MHRGPRLQASAAALAGLLLAGCSPGTAAPSTSPTAASTVAPAPSTTVGPAPVTFDQATAALSVDLVPSGAVKVCEEYEPGSPEAEQYQAEAVAERAAAGAEALRVPLPECGQTTLGDLRAASIAGDTASDGSIHFPVAGGQSFEIVVYELPDEAGVERLLVTTASELEYFADDQDKPLTELPDNQWSPREVIIGGSVDSTEVESWAVVVRSHDSSLFNREDAPMFGPFSRAVLWATRGTLAVSVVVQGDVPGAADDAAIDVFTRYVTAIDDSA